jgi:hypothetical protein
MQVASFGRRFFYLFDTQLKGTITWREKGVSGVFLFSTEDRAQAYLKAVRANRPVVVSPLEKRQARAFVESMINAGIEYALIDVPPEQTDILNSYDDEVVRNYAVASLKTLRARMS